MKIIKIIRHFVTSHSFESPSNDVFVKMSFDDSRHVFRVDSYTDADSIGSTTELDLTYLHDQPFCHIHQFDFYEIFISYEPGESAIDVSIHYDDDDEPSPHVVRFANVPIIVIDSNGKCVPHPDDPDEFDYFVMHTTK